MLTTLLRGSLAGLAVIAAACSIRTGDMTLLTTKNIPSMNAVDRGPFEASDCKVFGIPNLKEAVDRAIEKGDGNAMIDAALYQETYPFVSCFRAKGRVVQLRPSP